MTLKDRLQADLHQAMRARDKTRVSVLRMLKSSIGYEEIEKKGEVKDPAIVDIISRQARQRRESIEMFRQGGRQDLVEKETAELAVLQEYLPAQLSPQELEDLAKAAIAEAGAVGPGDKGRVMKLLMPRTRGKAEGSAVNRVVTGLLSGSAP